MGSLRGCSTLQSASFLYFFFILLKGHRLSLSRTSPEGLFLSAGFEQPYAHAREMTRVPHAVVIYELDYYPAGHAQLARSLLLPPLSLFATTHPPPISLFLCSASVLSCSVGFPHPSYEPIHQRDAMQLKAHTLVLGVEYKPPGTRGGVHNYRARRHLFVWFREHFLS